MNAEYVAYNIQAVSDMAGGLIAVISHSLGCDLTQWAFRFWPSLYKATSKYIGLNPDFSGIGYFDRTSDLLCSSPLGVPLCAASIWQQLKGSHYYTALRSPGGQGFKAHVNTSIIWSETDGLVNPPEENAQLPGAVVHSIQELCPEATPNHSTMLINAGVYAMVQDALNHGGHVSLDRLRESIDDSDYNPCDADVAPGMKPSALATAEAVFNAFVAER